MNADSTDILEATQGTTHGANLFAYCNNNPVNYVDYTGKFSIVGLIFVIISVVVFVFIAYLKWKSSLFYTFCELYKKTYNYFTPFYVHAQNVVEYGTGINPNPTYPDYYKLGIDKSYSEVCENAYKTAIEFGFIKDTQTWGNMSDEEKYVFTSCMLVYDRDIYYKILMVYMVELIGWGIGTVLGFASPTK